MLSADAQFVGSFAHAGYVYTFYREQVETGLTENGHLVHARVSRVCIFTLFNVS